MSLSRFRNVERDFLRFVKCSFPSILRLLHYDLFREIAGLLYCSHFLDQQTVLDEFSKLQKYLSNLNCDSHHPALVIHVWLTYGYKKLYQFKDMLCDEIFQMPRNVKMRLHHLYRSFNPVYENHEYHSCLSVNSGRIKCDQIALLPFCKELWFEIQNGVTNHTQIFSQYRLQTEEMKAFILFHCMSRLYVALPLSITKMYCLNNCSNGKLPLTDGVAFSECIFCTKNKMLMTASTDNSAHNGSRLTACNKPFDVKCDQSFKMDFVTGDRSVSFSCNEKTGKLEGKISSSPFQMQAKSNKDFTSSNTSLALLCNSTCAELSDFSHSCYKENVSAEITNSSGEAVNFNGKDFELRRKLSFDASDSSSSFDSTEIESIEDIASASIISHSASPQTRRFLSITLSSSSSDDSVSETSEFDSEHTDDKTLGSDDENAVSKASEFDSKRTDDESICFTCYKENVSAEITNSSGEAANFNGKDFELRRKLSFDASDSSSSFDSTEIESIEDIASASIISHSASPQTRRFLSITLSSSSSDDSVSETSEFDSEHTDDKTLGSDDENAVSKASEFDSKRTDDESICFTCYKENVSAEITNSSGEAANFNGKDFELRRKLSFDASDSSSSFDSTEIESIEDIASASIISHSASPQTRRFLSTSLSSSSSDDSVSETSEFDSEHTDDKTLGSDDKSIVFETIEFDNIYIDETSYYEDSASEMSDSDSGNISNYLKLHCDTLALNKHDSTLNWVKTFYASKEEDDDFHLASGGEENFKVADFESYDSNSNVESSLSDFNFHDMFVTLQQYRKYWKVDETISPLRKSDEFKENEVQDVDEPNRARKVTFAPDESLVTVRVFEREPEELLPDPYELDRIRFQMRIHSFSFLLDPFFTTEHRAKILQRNSLNGKEL